VARATWCISRCRRGTRAVRQITGIRRLANQRGGSGPSTAVYRFSAGRSPHRKTLPRHPSILQGAPAMLSRKIRLDRSRRAAADE
jgi:hypothetical protein